MIFLGRRADRREAQRLPALDDLGPFDDRLERRLELGDDIGGRALGNDDADDRVDEQIGIAELGDRGDVGQIGLPLAAGG